MRFQVWAPKANRVDLVLSAAGSDPAPADRPTAPVDPPRKPVDLPMSVRSGGWWTVENADAAPGSRYGYRLDGASDVRPDPRSRRQPDGVHQLSAVFDPAGYAWADQAWTGRPLPGAVIYELHVGTFTPAGTLDAAVEKLDHLVDLGVTAVELLPVNGFNGVHNWGYDGVLWYTVHEPYGGPAAYLRFVDACHQRGLAVIQDVVYNHLGPSGNYLPEFGPYLHEGRANTWGSSVNLDGPDSDEVRRFIIDNALMWLGDYHVDGLRLDAVHALADTRAVHLLEELAVEVAALAAHVGRPLSLIAESDLADPRLITPREGGGYGLHAQWNDDFHHVVHVALTGETDGYYADFGSIAAIAKVFTAAFFHDGGRSSFRGRDHGRPVDVHLTPGSRFVVFTQDHDQIGNRAIGDRLTAQLNPGQLAIAAVLLYTSPFTPMLFMGEEWAAATPWQFFTSHPEPELGELTAQGRLAEFEQLGWDPALVPDPQDPATFDRSNLDWSELEKPEHARMLDLYRALAVLRRSEPDLSDPRLNRTEAGSDEDRRTLWVRRGRLLVAANFSATTQPVVLPGPAGEILLGTAEGIEVDGDRLALPPHSAAVLRAQLPPS